MIGLALNPTVRTGALAAPKAPTFIPVDPRRAKRTFKSIGALAGAIHRCRDGRGLQLRSATATFQGSPVFPAIELWWLIGDDAEFVGVIAVQGVSREAMEAIIRDARASAGEGAEHLLVLE